MSSKPNAARFFSSFGTDCDFFFEHQMKTWFVFIGSVTRKTLIFKHWDYTLCGEILTPTYERRRGSEQTEEAVGSSLLAHVHSET